MLGLLTIVRAIFGIGYMGLHIYIARQVYLAGAGFWKSLLTVFTLIFGDMYWCYQWGALALGVVTLLVGALSFMSGMALKAATEE
ncbi:MAG TPA: hypothetical protein VJ866_08300 [Pyrinomonadaceae bacterium]|nr:hypothetical protein [Pyrinomonadaceae bacterium]